MKRKQKTAIIVLLFSILAAGLMTQTELFSNNSQIEIELLSEPVAGETNTLQASSNKTNLENTKLYINGEKYGQLNKAGITKFTVPQTEKMTVKINDYSETFDVQQSENRYERGINLEKEPVQGEINRITLIKNGERIENQTIYINNKEIGQTKENGAITFTVPQTDQIKIKTSGENFETEIIEVKN